MKEVAENCKAALLLHQVVPLAFRTAVASGADMDELREMLCQPSLITGEDARTESRVQTPERGAGSMLHGITGARGRSREWAPRTLTRLVMSN